MGKPPGSTIADGMQAIIISHDIIFQEGVMPAKLAKNSTPNADVNANADTNANSNNDDNENDCHASVEGCYTVPKIIMETPVKRVAKHTNKGAMGHSRATITATCPWHVLLETTTLRRSHGPRQVEMMTT
jgi:mRNA-degrading endonuclease toxin of MazEF toxin-antitoxin module